MRYMIRCLAVAVGLQLAGGLRADELAPPTGKVVVIDVTIVEVTERSARVGGLDPDAADKIQARVKELEKQGLAAVTRVRLSGTEAQQVTAQFMESGALGNEGGMPGNPQNRGRGGFPGQLATVSRANFGTLINVTPRFEEDGSLLLELQVDKSAPGAAGPDAVVPSRVATTATKSALRLKNGQVQIANVVERSQPEEYSETVVFVTARFDPSAGRGESKASPKESANESRVFRLQRAVATQVAKILVELMADKRIVIRSEEATNSVLVSGTKEQIRLVGELIKLVDLKTGE